MGAPEIILIVLMALGLGLELAQHGKPKEGAANFWTSLIATAVTVALLTWGGFWK